VTSEIRSRKKKSSTGPLSRVEERLGGEKDRVQDGKRAAVFKAMLPKERKPIEPGNSSPPGPRKRIAPTLSHFGGGPGKGGRTRGVLREKGKDPCLSFPSSIIACRKGEIKAMKIRRMERERSHPNKQFGLPLNPRLGMKIYYALSNF